MARVILFLLLLITGNIIAQQNTEHEEVKKTVETFFKGLNQKDTILINSVVHKDIVLQGIRPSIPEGNMIKTDVFSNFLKAIVSIPKDQNFEEKIHSYKIDFNDTMAHVWTEYTFWFDGNVTHCGVNSFQLIKENMQWKIFYIIDTRRTADCEE
ncbi:nuclear transport factor 2 family protein [Lacinutrix cladophorae]